MRNVERGRRPNSAAPTQRQIYAREVVRSNTKGPKGGEEGEGKKKEEEKARARKGKRKGRTEGPPGKRQRQRKERENRARDRDVIFLLQLAGTSQPGADCWHEAHFKAVPEKKRQCTIKGAGGPLLGKLDRTQHQWK